MAEALRGPVRVLAGAGTGKTRAITHRIAYGVAVGAYQPTAVLAVTFTTRAAGEMRGRLQQLGARGVQARTFHSAALRQAQYFWPKAYGGEFPSVLDNRMSLVAESAGRLRVRVDTARLRELAVRAFRLAGCDGLARVDFFVGEEGEVLLNEVNTMPGMTSTSVWGKLWAASGLEYPDALDRLCRLAVERFERERGHRF